MNQQNVNGMCVLWAFLITMPAVVSAHEYEAYARSAAGTARSYAGEVTKVSDASVVYANPAAMANIGRNNTSVVMHAMKFRADYNAQGEIKETSQKLVGSEAGDLGGVFGGPNLYWLSDSNNAFRFGVGLNTPYAYGTDYESNWVGRYHGTRSLFTAYSFTSSGSFTISDNFSIGVSIPVTYVSAEFDRALNQQELCISNGLNCSHTPIAGQLSSGNDAMEEITADGWGVGWAIGFHYVNVDAGTSIGMVYRGEETIDISGDANYKSVDSAIKNSQQWTNTEVDTGFLMPAELTVGVSQALGQKMVVMADVTWKDWSKFDGWEFDYKNLEQSRYYQRANWSDGLRTAVALDYALNSQMTLHTGYAYDNSPVKNSDGQSSLIIGSDIQWYSIGVTFKLDEAEFVIGYAYLDYGNVILDLDGGRYSGQVTSQVDMDLNLLSMQYNYAF
jgi:long-chain fatty acid transport protein